MSRAIHHPTVNTRPSGPTIGTRPSGPTIGTRPSGPTIGRMAGTVLTALLLLVAAACGNDSTTAAETPAGGSADSSASIQIVEPEAARQILESPPDDLTVIDVRTPEEFAEGHLADAVLINIYDDDFSQQLDALDRNSPYVIYCRSGNRSEQARQAMADLGFTDVTDIAGGIEAWQAAGLPTVN